MKKLNPSLIFLILIIALFIRIWFAFRPFWIVDSFLLSDDTYFFFHIAKNWKEGHPFTEDGVHLTNGFHPLFVFLIIPLFFIFPKDLILPVKSGLLILSFINVLSGLLIFLLVKDKWGKEAGFFSLLLWSFSPTVIKENVNGMETALAVFFVVLSSWFYLCKVRDSNSISNIFFLGILTGGAILARMDEIFLTFAIMLDFLLLKRKEKLKKIVFLLLGVLIVILPWFIVNIILFNTILPVSGEAVKFQNLAFERFTLSPSSYIKIILSGISVLLNSPVPIYIFLRTMTGFLGIWKIAIYIACSFIAGWLFYKILKNREYKLNELRFSLFFIISMILFYSFIIMAPFRYHPRYYAPFSIFVTIFLAILLKKYLESKFKIIIFVSLFLLFLPGLFRFGFSKPEYYGFYPIGKWIDENLPDGTRVGSYQSGAMGYFGKDKLVVNLDGVVNRDALMALKEGRSLDYVRSEHLEYIIDWDESFEFLLRQCNKKPIDSSKELKFIKTIESFKTGKEYWKIYRVEYP